ncbi:MAG: type II toxin-antitoxin system RelE/ParE family toxin [Lachnospiraceae bacterium]|nr:type II toxin-antitoxin system RelE/ParE family toxin [Lachnospiraceae bacterium]
MKKLKYSPDYTEKMREIKKYLDFQFSGDVRKKVIKEIGSRVRSLCEHEQVGISVHDMYGVDTDCLCIFVAKNYVFYRIEPDCIYVVNIYNEREDFMMDLFGIKTTPNDHTDSLTQI